MISIKFLNKLALLKDLYYFADNSKYGLIAITTNIALLILILKLYSFAKEKDRIWNRLELL